MIHCDRLTANLEGGFVVFLIGMRINRPSLIHKWWPVAVAMPRMLKELYRQPELGFLHAEMWFSRTLILLQYWRSIETFDGVFEVEGYGTSAGLAGIQ